MRREIFVLAVDQEGLDLTNKYDFDAEVICRVCPVIALVTMFTRSGCEARLAIDDIGSL